MAKVITGTMMYNAIKDEEEWEKDVYGPDRSGGKDRVEVPQRGEIIKEPGYIGREEPALPPVLSLAENPFPGPPPLEAPPPLPPPPPSGTSLWQAHTDETGHTFYYNTMTGVSQWEKPP